MRQPVRRPSQQNFELAEALGACRSAFISIRPMSGMSNVLMLTGAIESERDGSDQVAGST